MKLYKRKIWILIVTLLALCLVTVGMAAARAGATYQVQQPDSETDAETLLEQEMAREAQQQDAPVKTLDALFSGNTYQYPLFIGVDDLNVPAYVIDPSNNDTVQAFVGTGVWGAAYDLTNNRILFNSGTFLYEWPVGGAVNLLGPITDPGGSGMSFVGLAWYGDTLFATRNIANEGVYIIDLSTLVATIYIDYVDEEYDFGGVDADPNDGSLYATNDDTDQGLGLFRINLDGSATLIEPYPAGQTDIDGLAVSDDGYAYLVTDEPGFVYVYDFAAGDYTTPLDNPWTTSELFAGGAYIYEPEPSILFRKTVGLDPSACSSSEETFVTPGGEVTYCYTVFNTGAVTLTLHTLEDSQLGLILEDFPYILVPGASAFLTQSQVITAAVVNTATWTAYNPGPIDVVSGTDTAKVSLLPAACPAGYEEVFVESAFFEQFPPPGWTITNTTTDCDAIPEWTDLDPAGRGNLTGGSGSFAIADSDACGSGSLMNTAMTSAPLNFSGLVSPTITFYTDYNNLGMGGDIANFDVSLDGGLTWQNLLSWDADVRGPLLAGTSLPGAGEDDVMVRWDYQNASWDWWWEVDDVLITACSPSPDIEIEPDEISGTQTTDAVVTHTLTISNLGIGPLDWEILEEETLAASAPASLPEYVAGLYAPSIGPAPQDGVASAAPAAGMQSVQALPGTMVRSLVYGTHEPYFTIFDLDTPDVLPSTAIFTGTGEFIGAGEFVDGLSYMVDVTHTLFVVDDSGALLDEYPATPPPLSQSYTGMALDPTTGEVYASSTDIFTSTLFTFDVHSGEAVAVGGISGAPAIIAISFDGAGNLFGYDLVNDEFMQIDPATGATSNLVPLPFDANFGQGMGFDPATGMLYMLAFNGGTFQAELWMVDVSDPAAPVFNFVDVLGASLPGGLNQLTWGGTDDCLSTDIPWLEVNPISGTTGAGLSDMVDVTFDSTGLAPDVYTGALCVRSNDPDELVLRVPVTLTVALASDLSLTKSASKEPVSLGETFEYTLLVENAGPDEANNVTLVDTLPAGVTFVSASAGCSHASGVVTCDLGTLAAGADIEVSIVVMAPDEEGIITNSASVSADELDINPQDNSASLDTTVTWLRVFLPLIQH